MRRQHKQCCQDPAFHQLGFPRLAHQHTLGVHGAVGGGQLQQVDAGVEALKIDRKKTTLVASSERIAIYARGLGWTDPLVCEAFDLQTTQEICARIDHGG